MIARYNRWSFVFGVPGVTLQIVGRLMMMHASQQGGPTPSAWLWYGAMVLGTVLLMIGLAYYAKAKGQSFAWCIAAFLSILGLLLLLLLEDRSESTRGVGEKHEKA
jgi:hypothetical protein